MERPVSIEDVAIDIRSKKLLMQLLEENPRLKEILVGAKNDIAAKKGLRSWMMSLIENRPKALSFYEDRKPSPKQLDALKWPDFAVIRILDYLDHAGRTFVDPNLRCEEVVNDPVRLLWLAVHFGTGGTEYSFFDDFIHLFRQLSGNSKRRPPSREKVAEWMMRHPSGLDPRIRDLREKNKRRILKKIVERIESGKVDNDRYEFDDGMSFEEKMARAEAWWNTDRFHLDFAVRSPEILNEMLDHALDPVTMGLLDRAKKRGIPFFVNPYYLSLLNVNPPDFAIGADVVVRDYIIYSEELIDEFGHITAWEKEDLVEPGKPNAAGWILPALHNIHRRYPEVAILIPDTVGRACGGLCSTCQRMYDFQRGHLNFDLKKLRPSSDWPKKLEWLLDYFENDSQLRDILITGGDALMNTDETLKAILDAVYKMALRKKLANEKRPNGEKYAEIVRVRLGTRLLAYLPQRINDDLVQLLAAFKKKAKRLGIQQFVLQAHFETPLEVTDEAAAAVKKIISAGWMVANQLVFNTAASRRGHAAKLRQVLGDIGVIPYYTFGLKGFRENRHGFATNARAVQEQAEEQIFGRVPKAYHEQLRELPLQARRIKESIARLLKEANVPFLASDRNVMNLPGVGKSLTFRVIGLTRGGRRILEFDHDTHRSHSPITETMGKVVIIESKSIYDYLNQLDHKGEDLLEYQSLYGYSIGITQPRLSLFDYPEYDYEVTETLTNFDESFV